MIYIIGGAPRCGKTKLAKKLSRALNFPMISTDHLRVETLKKTSEKMVSKYFPLEEMFRGDKVDRCFLKYTSNDFLKADLKEAGALWTDIKKFLENELQKNKNYIVEGVHLLPKYIHQLPMQDKLRVIYLGKLDKRKILEGLKRNIDKKDWILGHIKKKITLTRAAEMVSLYSKYFIRQAIKNNYKFLNTEEHFCYLLNCFTKDSKSANNL